ncbi:hypothetical protein BGZ99_007851 [Dissophora globulifera]|uniref:Uncharacterized protein n=1 Tax=Dissophora globulifera TaxID=979702 RepID=A0A9P6UQ28_9FUNG|nr:hypothetical protein BGZ99_007851 [Dissophora globulifera]
MVQSRTRRFMVCGVPITYELALRLALLLITIGALVAAAIPKVRSIIGQANVVSVSVSDAFTIPVPNSLICGQLLDTADVEMVSRGAISANGTIGPDIVRPVPTTLYRIANASDLQLRAGGDWPTTGKCVVLEPKGLLFGTNEDGDDENQLDNIVVVVKSKDIFNTTSDIGVAFAMWDGNVVARDQQPLQAGIPSINSLTFVYSEHILINSVVETRYALQKQNIRTLQAGFFAAAPNVISRIILSPDTFYVTKYIDKRSYTWVDLLGAIGGMASIAIAVWIFLFGGGKYKSWGIMQRYILRTSPDSRRGSDEEKPKNSYEAAKRFFKKQLSRMDSSADTEMDVPLQSTFLDQRRLTRYSTAMDTATAAAIASGASSGKGSRVSRVPNLSPTKHDFEYEPSPRYSMESSGPSNNFYFSERGAPGSRSLQPLAPVGEGYDDEEEQVSELIRLIDLRVDERMWSLEKTLSRYYLDGFRLRNYSAQYNSARYSNSLDKEDEAMGGPRVSVGTDHQAQMSLIQGIDGRPYSSSLSSPPIPLYPPRPVVRQQYEFIDEADRVAVPRMSMAGSANISQPPPPSSSSTSASKQEISSLPSVVVAPPAGLPNSSPAQNNGNNMLAPGLPQQRDMRRTIRTAVERLQNEWPQSHMVDAYVPRTQYRADTSDSNIVNNTNNNNTDGNRN